MSDHMEEFSNRNDRLAIFYVIFSLMFCVLLGALAYRQIYLYDYYIKRGDRQSLRRIVKPGARGDIYDRNGNLIVGNEAVFSAVVYYNELRGEFREEFSKLKKEARKNNEKINSGEMGFKARKNVLERHVAGINKILKSDYDFEEKDFQRHFSTNTLLPLPLIKQLTPKEHAILAERLSVDSPVQIFTDTSRYYPYGDSAAHTIGFVADSFDSTDENMAGEELRTFIFKGKIGKSGIEKAFNDVVSGRSGYSIWVVDTFGYQYSKLEELRPKKGKSITCSIDIELQQAIEDAYKERKGAAVVLDVKTGEVLSAVSQPAYNLNDLVPRISQKVYNEITENGGWLNKPIQGLYPPGSTFKIVTACAGLMSGKIDGNTVVHCAGGLKVGSRIFPCHKKSGHGDVDLKKAVSESCNVFFYQAGLDMGINQLAHTASDFGLDKQLPFELKENYFRKTIVPTPAYKKKYKDEEGPWSGGDTANTSIGQGFVLQTPMHMACMIASFARKETMTRPSILHDKNRITDMNYHGAKKLELTDMQYKMIVDGMREAVITGTAKRGRTDVVEAAAKSGTAQITAEGRKLTLAWMIGFAPADNPEIAFAIMVEGEEPGDASGGRTGGPIMKALLEKYFKKEINADE